MSYDLKIVCIVALIGIGTEGKSEKQKTKNKMQVIGPNVVTYLNQASISNMLCRSSNIHTKRTHIQKRLDYMHINGSWYDNQHNWWGVGCLCALEGSQVMVMSVKLWTGSHDILLTKHFHVE